MTISDILMYETMSIITGVKPDLAVMVENMERSILSTAIIKQDRLPETGSMSWRVLSSDPTARAYIEGNHVTASAEVTADNWTNGIWSQFWRDLHPTEEEMHANENGGTAAI